MTKTILQILPELVTGGVERGTIDMAAYIKEQGWNSIVASNGGQMMHELERLGIPHIQMPLHSKNPIVMQLNVLRLSKIIEAYDVDILHARSRAPAWSGYQAAKKTGCHFVTSFHGTYKVQNKFKHWYNGVMTRGERVIAVSQFIKEHMIATYGTDPAKIDVVPRGVDLARFDPAKVREDRIIKLLKEWNVPEDKRVIMLPGRLTRWKGHLDLLEALYRLPSQDYFCLFVGGGEKNSEYVKEIEEKVASLNLLGRVRFTGECGDMPAAYLLSDVVVSASREPEAFGRIAIEAQAMGRPIVATAHGGSMETIVPEQTGFLCRAGDVEMLSSAINRALTLNASARDRFAQRSMAHAHAHFSREAMCKGEFSTYATVLGTKKSASQAA